MIIKDLFSNKTLNLINLIKKRLNIFLIFNLIIFFQNFANAEIKKFNIFPNEINFFIKKEIKESFSHSGLASYYNNVSAFIINDQDIKKIKQEMFYFLKPSETLVIIGRYNVLMIDNLKTELNFEEDKLNFKKNYNNDENFNQTSINAQLLLKSDIKNFSKPYHKIKYVHLWYPLSLLCAGVESTLVSINKIHNFGWGITIIIFSFLFKIFTLPVNIYLIHVQRRVSNIQISLASELDRIKLKFSGKEAHEKFIEAHKSKGVTPYYKLRTFLPALFPIPFLIAIFNVLGELDLILGNSFLWIKDLAYPDTIFHINSQFLLFINNINLLPILMTLLTVFGALFYKNKIISKKELNKQKLNLCFMALFFLILFYSFPSAMVLYWTFNNIWQLIQQKFISI